MDVEEAIHQYYALAKHVFSDLTVDGRFDASKLEEFVKYLVEEKTSDSESPLLEDDESRLCRTYAPLIRFKVDLISYFSPIDLFALRIRKT